MLLVSPAESSVIAVYLLLLCILVSSFLWLTECWAIVSVAKAENRVDK